jgi:hypothetical protein
MPRPLFLPLVRRLTIAAAVGALCAGFMAWAHVRFAGDYITDFDQM